MGRQPTQPVGAFRPGQDLRPLYLSPPPPEEDVKVLKNIHSNFKTGYMEVFEGFVKSFFSSARNMILSLQENRSSRSEKIGHFLGD